MPRHGVVRRDWRSVDLRHGTRSKGRNSIGMVLVTGMVIGTIFTLFVVPVFYSLLAANHAPALAESVSERDEFMIEPVLQHAWRGFRLTERNKTPAVLDRGRFIPLHLWIV